jgi:putative ABC transport system permease protein
MMTRRSLLARIRALFSRTRLRDESDEEVRFHIEMEIEHHRARGLSPADARRAAHIAFGGVQRFREETRAARGGILIDSISRDIRVALRGFRRTPTFALAVVAILGVGIGTAVAMFTTFETVLVRQLPVADENRVVVMWTQTPTAPEMAAPATDLPEVRRAMHTMRAVAGVVHFGASPRPFVDGDHAIVLSSALVTSNYFEVLGAKPALGRLLRTDDESAGMFRALVLSYGTWQSQFGGNPAAVGRTLVDAYTRQKLTIVGVAPPGLDYPSGTGSWSAMRRENPAQVLAVARLAPGASMRAARDEYLSIESRLEPTWKLTSANADTFPKVVLGDVRPLLVALAAAVALLLLIACVNVGTLFLVRANSRTRELAVRRALGASSGDLVRQLVIESALLAVAGGAIGVACAAALLRALVAFAPSTFPRLDSVQVHGNLLEAALAITTLCTLLFGVIPALAAAGVSLQSPLRRDGRSGAETKRRRVTRQWLVASQVALALVMLSGAGLLARSLERLERIELGYNAGHLSILSTAFDGEKYFPHKMAGWAEQVMDGVRAIPGVTSVTPIMMPPFYGPNFWHPPFQVEGAPLGEARDNPSVPVEAAGADYFRTFDTPLLRGRGFTANDRENAVPVIVVNESAVRQLWPGQDPIGKRIRFAPLPPPPGTPPDTSQNVWRTVVGIVPDTHFRSLRATTPMVYIPWRQFDGWQGVFAVRSTSDIGAIAADMRRVFKSVDPTLVLFDVKSMDTFLDGPLAEPRLSALLLAAFGIAALVLAAVGLYGVMSSVVREQTREIGIRLALGATPELVRRAVLRQALIVAGAGAVVGLAGALATTRLLKSLLFEVSPTDPVSLALVSGVLIAAAGAAAYLPARRATRVDPATVLRSD